MVNALEEDYDYEIPDCQFCFGKNESSDDMLEIVVDTNCKLRQWWLYCKSCDLETFKPLPYDE